MESITVERLEKILDMKPEDVGKKIQMQRSGIYKLRKKYPDKYKILLLGIRLQKSPLKIKEILDALAPMEKLAENVR